MAIPAPLLLLAKNLVVKAVMKNVTKTVDRKFNKIVPGANADNEIIEIQDTIEAVAISPKKVSAWVSVVTALACFASAQGYIDPALADLISSILSNPETVEAIENVVE